MITKNLIKHLLNAIFMLLFIVLIANFTSWDQLKGAFQQISGTFLCVGILCLILTYALRAHRFYILLADNRPSWLIVLKVMLQHNAINNLLPFRLGELSFPLLLKNLANIHILTSTKTLLTARLFDFLIMSAIAVIIVFKTAIADKTIFITMVIAVMILSTVLIILITKTDIIPFHRQLRDYIGYVQNNLKTAGSLSLLIWALKILGQALLLTPMLNTQLTYSLLAIIVVEGTAILPINGPANFGSLEGAAMAVLLPFGLEASTILSAILNLHLAIIMLAAFGYLVSLLIPTKSLSQGEFS